MRPRLAGVLVAFLVLFLAVGAKIADLQLLRPTEYRELSHSQRLHEQELSADRGTIFDRDGQELAVSIPQHTVFVDPGLVVDPVSEARQLAGVLDVDSEVIESKMTADNRFGYVARQVPNELADEVRALDLPSVALAEEPRRFRPNDDLAGSILGLTDVDSQGISGIEKQYGELLTGVPGKLTAELGADGRTIPMGDYDLEPPVKGHDLVLSLDRALQFEAERILSEHVAEASASGGTAIVMAPGSGEILAMASVVRHGSSGDVVVDSRNAAVTSVFEPGSVMKIVPAAAAIEDGHVNHADVLHVPGSIIRGEEEFDEHEPRGPMSLPVSSIIAQSSNVGTILLAEMLGADRLHQYLRSFGFGEKTPLEFPNEEMGLLRPPGEWWGSSIASIPIGQGVSVTGLQMLLAYNVIANGGTYVPPSLVTEVVSPEGERSEVESGEQRRIVSEDTADQMNMILRGAVAVGTGANAALDAYTVAGKTGTALKPQPDGGYVDGAGNSHYQAAFAGFVPAEQPELSILVMIDEPSSGIIFGGELAAPVFASLAEVSLRRLGIPPPTTDRAERFADALPAEAEGHLDQDGAARATGTSLDPTADGRVRALPVGEEPPGQPAPDEQLGDPGEGPVPAEPVGDDQSQGEGHGHSSDPAPTGAPG